MPLAPERNGRWAAPPEGAAGEGARHTARSPWDEARNVLCVRLDAIGDVLMTTPAIRAVKESMPGRSVTLLTSPAGAAIASMVPELDSVIVYEAPWMKATPARDSSALDREMVEGLRNMRFDASVIFTVYSQSPLPAALLCRLADIPLRLAHCRENPYHLLTDWVPETEPQEGIRHECRRQLDLVASIGCRTPDERMSLAVSERAKTRVRELLERSGVDSENPWAVVHPGATAPSRRYPPEHFAEVCRLLSAHGWQLILTGSREEAALVEQVRASTGAIPVAGRLDLEAMAALLALAPMLISNNTGPAHMAAALGTPVVDIYALTNPQHTPWAVPHRVLSHDVPCKYCYKSVCPQGHHECLRLLAPDEVVRAALELAEETAAARTALEVCP